VKLSRRDDTSQHKALKNNQTTPQNKYTGVMNARYFNKTGKDSGTSGLTFNKPIKLLEVFVTNLRRVLQNSTYRNTTTIKGGTKRRLISE
jgi:hypothetical protein